MATISNKPEVVEKKKVEITWVLSKSLFPGFRYFYDLDNLLKDLETSMFTWICFEWIFFSLIIEFFWVKKVLSIFLNK